MRSKPYGYWRDPENLRVEIESRLAAGGLGWDDAPRVCRTRWFRAHGLSNVLIRRYRGSPYLCLTALFPGRWTLADFPWAPHAEDVSALAFGAGRPDDAGARHYHARLARRRRAGLCFLCDGEPAPGRDLCPRCLEERRTRMAALASRYREAWRRWSAEDYRRRKAAGLCAMSGCADAPAEGRVYCEHHATRSRV